jgi:two-component system, OmpR family, sensor histidine kinase QseC
MTERRARHSIKRRLLVALLATILFAWIATLLLSYRDTRHELDELLDAHLAQSASLLIAQVGHEVDDIDDEHAPPVHRYSRKVAFQIWEKGKRLLLHSASAPNVPLSSQREGFSNSEIDGDKWRVFSAWDDKHHFLVQVGERRETRDKLVVTVAKHLLQPLLITLPLLGLLIWFGVARGLRPLQELGRQVAARRPDNLAALEVAAAPVEVVPLVEGLNQLFARVRVSLDSERRFTADAAHELRTPLAAIKTQAQVARAATAETERRHALGNVLVGCDRAAHLVEQLLTLARLEPESASLKHPERCNLHALAVTAVAELAPVAIDKDIDLQLAEGDAVHVPGEPALLTILLRNLIDNAIRYSPRHSVVRVKVANAGDGAKFTVIDQGPGIPAESRALVWERFYRVLGTGETGSGLGLSITKRIADLHGASIALSEGDAGPGLRVSVTFPV